MSQMGEPVGSERLPCRQGHGAQPCSSHSVALGGHRESRRGAADQGFEDPALRGVQGGTLCASVLPATPAPSSLGRLPLRGAPAGPRELGSLKFLRTFGENNS